MIVTQKIFVLAMLRGNLLRKKLPSGRANSYRLASLDFSTNASGRKGPLDAVDVDPSTRGPNGGRSVTLLLLEDGSKWTGFSFGTRAT